MTDNVDNRARAVAFEDRMFQRRGGFAAPGLKVMKDPAALRAAERLAIQEIRRLNRRGAVKLDMANHGYYAAISLFQLHTRECPPRNPEAYVVGVVRNLAQADLTALKCEREPLWKVRHDLRTLKLEELAEQHPELPQTELRRQVDVLVDDLLARSRSLRERVPGDAVELHEVPAVPLADLDWSLLYETMLKLSRRKGFFTAHDRDTFELWCVAEFGTKSMPWHLTRIPPEGATAKKRQHALEQRLCKMLRKLEVGLTEAGFGDLGSVM